MLDNNSDEVTQVSLEELLETFTPSQLRAFRWVEAKLEGDQQVFVTVVGPASTGKSYLLKGLIELAKSKQLVVSKLSSNGGAATLIKGTTVHLPWT